MSKLRNVRTLLLLGFLLAMFTLAPAFAEPLVLDGVRDDFVINADGRDVLVDGHHNDVIIKGIPSSIEVQGHHNDVYFVQAGKLIVDGHHNDAYSATTEELVLRGHHNDIWFRSGTPKSVEHQDYNEVHYGAEDRFLGIPLEIRL